MIGLFGTSDNDAVVYALVPTVVILGGIYKWVLTLVWPTLLSGFVLAITASSESTRQDLYITLGATAGASLVVWWVYSRFVRLKEFVDVLLYSSTSAYLMFYTLHWLFDQGMDSSDRNSISGYGPETNLWSLFGFRSSPCYSESLCSISRRSGICATAKSRQTTLMRSPKRTWKSDFQFLVGILCAEIVALHVWLVLWELLLLLLYNTPWGCSRVGWCIHLSWLFDPGPPPPAEFQTQKRNYERTVLYSKRQRCGAWLFFYVGVSLLSYFVLLP